MSDLARRERWFGAPLSRSGLRGAAIVGTFATLLALVRMLHEPTWPTDFDQWHFAARSMFSHVDPYTVVGPDRAFRWDWPLYYPVPTLLLIAPLTVLPVQLARVVFVALSGSIFGYAITRDGYWRLPACLSAAFLICVWRTQWSLLMTAAFFVPLAGIFLAAKPNLALPMAAGARSLRTLVALGIAGIALAGIGLLVDPHWIGQWLATIRTKTHFSAPITNPGGFLLLLSLLRFRRPEARVFAALVLIPQTPSLYDLMPLFVIPRSLREVTILSLLTSALFFAVVLLGPFGAFNDYVHLLERVAVWVVYLPALAMLLRRPNVATDGGPPEPPASSFRAWLESLPRLDALLLLTALVTASLLFYAVMVTHRG